MDDVRAHNTAMVSEFLTKKVEQMAAQKWRALEDLFYPTDAAVIARLKAGENLTVAERGPIKHVKAGHIVTDIPAVSLPWLLANGHIEVVE